MDQPHLTEDAIKLKPGQEWISDALPIMLQLVEDGTDGGKVVVRGEFARSGLATENKRVYPRELWEREISKLEQSMSERKMFGELDHPNDGRTSLQRVSHIVTGMQIGDNGIVMGEAEAGWRADRSTSYLYPSGRSGFKSGPGRIPTGPIS